MAHQTIPTIPTAQSLGRNLSEFRSVPMTLWSESEGGQESGRKIFDQGYVTTWEWSKRGDLNETAIWSTTSEPSFVLSAQETGERYFIAYFDLDVGRHFRTFTEMGFEFEQNGKDKGALSLYNIGREYKRPRDGAVWSYSEDPDDYDYSNDRGQFFVKTAFDSSEVSVQKDNDYVLNRVYFHYKTNGSGSGGTGSAPYTDVFIYNLKFGWGTGEASENHRICLPKIRPFDRASKPEFGES